MTDSELERDALVLFEQMLDVPEDQRDTWIAERTQGRPELASRVKAIRAADQNSMLQTGAAASSLYEEEAPERIGAYRIVSRIGRGGMGSVYRGERETGDFVHVTAIKIIKPGLLSEALIERFERERQTLATLRHPNIAQLYDGGETESGSPYIIMEYVDGLPVLEWIETNAASTAERRRIFGNICAAVAIAHQNLIVHRDLTPSNVLVTHDGTVKLIDFGIARAADGEPALSGAEPASRSSLKSLSLTPGYAAPERMAHSQVTTAADVYSLGRLLEKILPPPSDDAELRAIIARATAQEAADRYATVDALRADVDSWGARLPVAAMAGGKTYVARKFVRRHRVAVLATAVGAVLVLGALGATWQAYSAADRARAAEVKRFNELRDLARYMLFDLNDRLKRVVGNTEARASLAQRAQAYLSALAASPGIGDDLRIEAAEGFIKLALIQGVPGEPNFGERDRAKANLDSAEKLMNAIVDPSLSTAPALARLHAHRAVIQVHGDNDSKAANRSIAAALKALDGTIPAKRDLAWMHARSTVRKAQLELADLSDDLTRVDTLAGDLAKEVGEWPAGVRSSREANLDLAYADYYRAYARSFDEKTMERSLTLFRGAEGRFRELQKALPNDPIVLYMLAWTGFNAFPAASQLGRKEDAAHYIELAQATIDRLLAIEARDNGLVTMSNGIREARAQWLRDQGRFIEAIATQREVIAGHRKLLADKRSSNSLSSHGFSLIILGIIGRDAKDRNLACESWAQADRDFTELDKRDKLLGFYKEFLPGLRANLAKCTAGRPVDEFGPLR
jgi:serine/threonine-protein kinase